MGSYKMIIKSKEIVCYDDKGNEDNEFYDGVNLYDYGYKCQPLAVYYLKNNKEKIEYKPAKGEEKKANKQTLPRLALQIFENEISALTKAEREIFPVCKYQLNDNSDGAEIVGLYDSVEEFRDYKKTNEYLKYKDKDGNLKYVLYGWSLFSDVWLAQACLEKYGEDGDEFVVEFVREDGQDGKVNSDQLASLEKYSKKLMDSKNIIFRGAPGTGKTYLARQIALNIVSKGEFSDYASLTKEEKEQFNEQIAFVQFHPSYDYTDFVEGLRPVSNDDGNMGFELKDGVFKEFVEKARKNLADSEKSVDDLKRESKNNNSIDYFLSNLELGEDEFNTITKTKFVITSYDEDRIKVSTSANFKVKEFPLRIEDLRNMLNSEEKFEAVKDVTNFFGKKYGKREYSYLLALYKEIMEGVNPDSSDIVEEVKRKEYVFIIDEINRGEISKIFGELFFSIDPGYRGEDGGVLTQYANLHDNAKEKFYIPENVYIIGTMNDIDRSVDTFDFAMRRRFRFIEVKANENIGMLDSLDNNEDVIDRMTSLNNAIEKVAGLNANYQIGASYFLKLKEIHYDYNILWSDYLKPLLEDYVQGMYDAEKIIEKLKAAYNLEDSKGDGNGTAQD